MKEGQLVVRQIAYGSSDYKKELEIRNEILRKPLGMNLFEEDLDNEAHDFHLGIYKGAELIGTLVLTPKEGYIKMRQVAIVESARGIKAGSRIVEFSEEFAKEKGYCKIELHARDTAVPFYLKLGYCIEGSEFTEVSIPHFKMVKNLI